MRDYAAMTTLVVERLQSSGTADYSVNEVNNGLTQALQEYSGYHPHLAGLTFNLESRFGTDVTASASSLTDSVKKQFVAADATDEKVIHNTSRNTRAVVLTVSSSTVITLGMNLMTANDNYSIYNKQCWNSRQVYVGDVPNYESIHSVEYPIGTRRNWKRYDKVLEIDLDYVPDSNANTAIVTYPNDVTALVRFIQPHVLPNLTDFAGNVAATVAVGATSISSSAWQSAGTINLGTEFTIENHRQTYIVAGSATIASNTVAISLYPPLEAAVSSTAWVITIRQSSLEPDAEDMIADLAAARIALNKAPLFLRSIGAMGQATVNNFITYGERRLAEVRGRLEASAPPKTSRRYPTD